MAFIVPRENLIADVLFLSQIDITSINNKYVHMHRKKLSGNACRIIPKKVLKMQLISKKLSTDKMNKTELI